MIKTTKNSKLQFWTNKVQENSEKQFKKLRNKMNKNILYQRDQTMKKNQTNFGV